LKIDSKLWGREKQVDNSFILKDEKRKTCNSPLVAGQTFTVPIWCLNSLISLSNSIIYNQTNLSTMNQKQPFFFLFSSPLIYSYITLFHLLLTTTPVCSIDPKFVDCEAKACGNQSISYPFYIKGLQESYCGYPGFGITCNNTIGFPILNLSNTEYIIEEIFYQNHSLRVSNGVFSRPDTNKGCLSPTQNLTFPINIFYLAPNQSEVKLFFGCDSTKLPRELQRNTIGCSEENKMSSVVALYGDDKNISLVSKNCREEVVIATVESVVKGGIEESLRNGFRLNWIASDCNDCNSTGGRCGFDNDIFTFQCYCTHRVHSAKCDTGFSLGKCTVYYIIKNDF